MKQYLSIFLMFALLAPCSLVAQSIRTSPPPAISSSAVPPTPNTLMDGTPVKMRLGRNVSSADAKVGEHVDFEVLEEVQVHGVVVIAKGATASATVTAAQPKRRMGREGKLDMTLDYVRLVDNEKAALTATAGGKGGTHTGAMVGAMAATAIFTLGGSALFLLMHGKDITIPKGTETTAYINGDMPLEMAKFSLESTPVSVSQAPAVQATVSSSGTTQSEAAIRGTTIEAPPPPEGIADVARRQKQHQACLKLAQQNPDVSCS